jgi:signal transduction histidine kinase
MVVSGLSVFAFGFFFVPPENSLDLDSGGWVALGTLLVVAAVVSELAARQRRAAAGVAKLEKEQAALKRVATLVAQGAPHDVVFQAVTREVGLLCAAELARTERYEPDGSVSGVAVWSRTEGNLAVDTRFALDGPSIAAFVRDTARPARVDSFVAAPGGIAEEARALGIRSSVGCPILVGGRLWGVIAASTTSETPFPDGTESIIGEFTELIAIAVANAEHEAELRASRTRIVAAGDETRRRLERDLHDGAQQRLVTLLFDIRAMEAGASDLGRLAAGIDTVLNELRELARGIHPAILSQGGIDAALKAVARRSPVPVELDLRTGARLPEPVEVATYYLVAEVLTNTAKHAQASMVHVEVEQIHSRLRVCIRDDGVGGADPAQGSGLVGLMDRVAALDGTIVIESPPHVGTSVTAEFPLAE